MEPTVTSNEADIAVLKTQVAALEAEDVRIEAMLLDGHRRLEAKLDKVLTDSMPIAVARSLARVWTFAGVMTTALLAALLHIAVNVQ